MKNVGLRRGGVVFLQWRAGLIVAFDIFARIKEGVKVYLS